MFFTTNCLKTIAYGRKRYCWEVYQYRGDSSGNAIEVFENRKPEKVRALTTQPQLGTSGSKKVKLREEQQIGET